MHTHANAHPFSGTTRVSRYQKGKTNLDFTEGRDSECQWHQLGHMQVCTSLQTDNHASTPPLCFLRAGCPSCRPTNSVKALKAINECVVLIVGPGWQRAAALMRARAGGWFVAPTVADEDLGSYSEGGVADGRLVQQAVIVPERSTLAARQTSTWLHRRDAWCQFRFTATYVFNNNNNNSNNGFVLVGFKEILKNNNNGNRVNCRCNNMYV